jgi:hypothetical protein
MRHKKDFNIKIELVQDGTPNCYVYDAKDMVTLNSITDEWFEKLTSLRKVYPKNRLLKHLISTAWGHMNANRLAEIQTENLDIGKKDGHKYKILSYRDYGHRETYELLNTESPYQFNIRLKPWITSISRNMTAEIALQNIDKVVRVQNNIDIQNKLYIIHGRNAF